MKRLPPTLREDKRYIKFRIHSEEQKDFGSVVETVWNSILSYTGEKGAGGAEPWIIKNQWSYESQEGVLKVNRDSIDDIRAALTLVDRISDKRVVVEIRKISGTLKSL